MRARTSFTRSDGHVKTVSIHIAAGSTAQLHD
jgi:hypothetical protein